MTRFARNATTETRAALARVAPNGIPYQSPVVCELVARRTERSKSFLHADGMVTTVARGRPLHRWDAPTGMWVDIGPLAALTDYTGGTADGVIRGESTTYATARATSSSYDSASATNRVGQDLVSGDYNCRRAYLTFDTSAIPDGDSITAATLYVKAYTDESDTDFNIQVYLFAWIGTWSSGPNMEADYDGAYGVSATLEGTLRNTADGWVSGTWYNIAVATAGINKTGDSRYSMASSRDIAGTTPTGLERVNWYSANSPGNQPYLAITHAAVGVAAVTAVATAAAPVATVVGGANIAVVAAAATAVGIGGATFVLDMDIAVENAAAAASAAVVPERIGETTTIAVGNAADAAAAAVVPAGFVLDMDFALDGAAGATAAAPTPTSILLGAGVTAVVAAATAAGPVPTIVIGASAAPPAATATAAAAAPTIVTERLSPLLIKINGTDRTSFIPVDSIRIDNVETNRVTSCGFHIVSGQALSLAELQSIVVSNPEETIRWFAGFILDLKELSAGPNMDYEVDCVDYSWLLEHPEALISTTYTSQTDAAVITAMMATACPDIQASTYIEAVYGAVVPNLEFKQATAREILDKLAEMSGASWYVDYGPGPGAQLAYLHYFDAATNDAPYDLSDTPNNSTTYSYEKLVRIKGAPEANRLEIKGGNDILVTRTLGLEGDYGRWLTAKLVDSDIQSVAQANAYGDNLLAKMAANPSYTCTVYREGLRAGQTITLTNAARTLAASTLQIKRVTTVFLGGGQAQYKLEIGKYLPKLADLLAKELGGGGGGAGDEGITIDWEDWIDDVYNVHYHDVTGNTSTDSGHTHGVGSLAVATEAAHTHAIGSIATASGGAHSDHSITYTDTDTGLGSVHSHSISSASTDTDAVGDHVHGVPGQCVVTSSALTGDYAHTHSATIVSVNSYAYGGHHHHYDKASTPTGNESLHTHNYSRTTGLGQGGAHTHTMSGSTAAGSSHAHALGGATASGGSHSHSADGTLVTGGPLLA